MKLGGIWLVPKREGRQDTLLAGWLLAANAVSGSAGPPGGMVVTHAMSPAGEHGNHVQLLIGAYVLGGLSPHDTSVVEAHLGRCAQCRAEHAELAQVRPWLDLLAGSADAAGPARPGGTRPSSGPGGVRGLEVVAEGGDEESDS
jgi:Putative zinc-finger